MKTILWIVVAAAVVGGIVYLTTSKTPDLPTSTPSESLSPSTSPSASVSPISYTLADVAKHATKDDCWTAINGNVYNPTPWIAIHPGGAANIMKICGKDGSALFNAQHSGNAKPAQVLTTLKIGVLAK